MASPAAFEQLGMLGSEYTLSPQPTTAYMPSPPPVLLEQRPYTPPDMHLPGVYPPSLVPVSAGELSSDSARVPSPAAYALRHRRQGSGASQPSPLAMPAALPRAAHRYNPLATVPAARPQRRTRRKTTDDFASDEDEDDYPAPTSTAPAGTEQRREEIRRQRIESEQRRRDELRDGYRRLKDALPPSSQKSSKVCLLDRATTHVKYLEVTTQQLQARVQAAEGEVARLRQFNEALMLGTAEARHAAASAHVQAAPVF
jgi:hypothetical protein